MSYPHAAGWRQPVTLLGKLARIDWLLLAGLAAIAAIGTATLYSVAGGSFEPYAERHAVRFMLGGGLIVLMALVSPDVWRRLALPAYAVALGLLVLVPFAGIEALGARRWIGAGSISIQPSELMKLALLAALAGYYQALDPARVSRPLAVLVPVLMVGAPAVLTLLQPDLGTTVLFVAVGGAVLFLAGVSIWYFVTAAAGTLAALPVVLGSLHGYQRKRIETFLDPDKDPLGAGYHINQSKIALGSGGVEGQGFMQGSQSQLEFLPEKHTDFAFTMFGEEWGFAGAVILLALYALVLIRLMLLASRMRDRFGRLLAGGLATSLFVYVFVNVGMVTGLLPVVGVPLPLVSYGGTAMLSLLGAFGLVMSAHVHTETTPRNARWQRRRN